MKHTHVSGEKMIFSLIMLAGFFGLSYEILLTRMLTNIFGSIFYVASGVMAAFFLGVAITSLVAQKYYRRVGLVEVAIGLTIVVYGVVFRMATDHSEVTFSLVPTDPLWVMLMPFVLSMIPALIIGCSLPMLFEVHRRLSNNDEGFSKVFAMYNFGAVLCVFVIEIFFVRKFGISSTVIAIGICNMLAGAHLHHYCRTSLPEVESETKPKASQSKDTGVTASLVVSSIAFGIFQVLALKIMTNVWGSTASIVAGVIGSALIGSAIGSYVVQKWKMSLETVFVLAAASMLVPIMMIEPATWFWSRVAGWIGDLTGAYITFMLQSLMVVLLLLPAYIFIGPTEVVAESSTKNGKAGKYIAVTSLGNAIGILIMFLMLHETLMDHITFVLIVAMTLSASLVKWVFEKND